jgi:asparagine synthase (glutamine-hydrolysing)
MEGIAGTYGHEDRALVGRMLRKLRHRGPDRKNVFVDDALVLGARAAMTSSHVKNTPIAERDGVAVASDSYIFNREALREAFVPDAPVGVSDAELVLGMYDSLGAGMFGYIDGAYAIAIADDGKTILARDRYGLKPLYLSGGIRNGSFSSEIKSQMLTEQEFIPFPPGKMMVRGKGTMPIRPKNTYVGREGGRVNIAALRTALTRATEQALENGDGANILLSGGVDSSAIAAAASCVTDDIDTVCVAYEGGTDADMARKVSEELGTNHQEREYEEDEMLDLLDDVVYSAETFDYPLVRSCIPNYLATHSFADRDRITLCGEGGDEVFAGYDYMREIDGDDRLRRERRHLLRTGHMTGFQRVDRMTSSASLDGRMPIMSRSVVDLGLGMRRDAVLGRHINESKLALRKAFADMLPEEVVTRKKKRFSDGAGSITALVKRAESMISDKEFERERKALPRKRIRTKEELLYYRAFIKHFDSPSAAKAVGFTPRP